jgi:hypothetical protein
MDDLKWVIWIVLIVWIGAVILTFAKGNEETERKIGMCMEAKHDRLWCEGLVQ